MYKTLGFKWLFEAFCPAAAFATADREVARNPQRFIHVPLAAIWQNQKGSFVHWGKHPPTLKMRFADTR
mgnify:CR=1 FL=1